MYRTPRLRASRLLGLRRVELVVLVVILSASALLLHAAYRHFLNSKSPAEAIPHGLPLPADTAVATMTTHAHEKPFEHRIMPALKAEALDKEKASVPEGVFLPGSLPSVGLGRTDVLAKCYVPDSLVLPGSQGCTISRKYKIIYHMTPKSGSSTGRHVVKNDFDGTDYMSGCNVPRGEDASKWMQIATLRNPATRAFASYEEMFVRRLGNLKHIPAPFQAFMKPFEGFLYPNYSAMFDKPAEVAKLTRAYERFMKDWDGKTVFDMHLERQVLYNVRRDASIPGRATSRHLSLVFDTHKMQEAFEWLAIEKNLDHTPKVIRGRAYPRRMNVSDVSDEAMQAMCRFYALDFCCLNYELPAACVHASVGHRVRCRWRREGAESLIETVVV